MVAMTGLQLQPSCWQSGPLLCIHTVICILVSVGAGADLWTLQYLTLRPLVSLWYPRPDLWSHTIHTLTDTRIEQSPPARKVVRSAV